MVKNYIALVLLLLSFNLSTTAQNERGNTSHWIHSDDSSELSVTTRNNVRFNDDYTDVLSIAGDGSVEVFERQSNFTRRLKIAAGANGQLVRTYSVNGVLREFDSEGKSWLAKMLAEAVSKGFDARNRAIQITRQSGTAGLLNEIPRLTGDYTKRVYLEEAVKSENFDAGALPEVLKLIASDISSDYEKATFLINTIGTSPINRKTQETYFAAVGTIKSDYEHGRVLKDLLKANPAKKEILMMTIVSAANISSNYERANVLIQIAQANVQDETIRIALLNAVKALASDYERGRVLNAVYLKETK